MLTEYQRYRLFEILPGLSVWFTFFITIFLSIFVPLWMIYFVLVFDLYWVFRACYFAFYLVIAWWRYHRASRIDWVDKMRHEAPKYEDKKHIVFLTLYNETWDVVNTAIESVAKSVYDPSKFTVVVAGEARQKENFDSIFSKIKNGYQGRFGEIIGTLHPVDLPDEIQGKGSNLHYSEQAVHALVDKRGWNYDEIIVTVFDIDTVCHPGYFSYLTYLYCNTERPTRFSYQPVALYNNNMWESPAVLRLMAFGTTFWLLTSLARQDGLVTFSSHSMSFRALIDAGYHDKRIVSEDSRIFYQCFLAYNGDYEVQPIYLPVSMDTTRDDSLWKSLKNLYKQQRRWAWGTEHIPFLITEFKKKGKLIPWYKKFRKVFLEWEGKWSWCLVAPLLTVISRMPMWFAGEDVRQSALFFNAPHMLGNMMTIATIGLLLSVILSIPLLPRRPDKQPPYMYVVMIVQWLLLPISMLLVSSIPAIDAVTHLMLGRYLGFNVSSKKRK
ncbi:MAG TPA: glycosyltransferase family 2 protein [Candidatus Magasanikbacteria bacterium]|nr:glycosyltransferase family 2 protein [Candidatus Magasanikbacteria bacterium]